MTLSIPEYRFILRRDPLSFTARAFYELNPQTPLALSPYLELLACKLEACRMGLIKRLIINMPPRHLKSHCASIAFIAWTLGHHPERHVICASYGQELSEKLARDCRRVMQSPWYRALFRTRLAPERLAVHDFMTTAQGSRMATSVEGPLTGRGADIIIIDDPLKPEDALSDTARTKVNQWFDNPVRSRLNDKENGCIIILMQRLHQDDLVGHVMTQEHWEQVLFPAIAEMDEEFSFESPLGRGRFTRKEGDALHPARESLVTLANIRQRMGEYNFSAQYQQNPIPLGGAMVKRAWLQYYGPADLPTRFSRIVQSWDTANKATELNNYSVCTVWGVYDKHYYLLDVFRARLNYPELKRKVIDLAERHSPSTVLIEDKASGTQLIQELRGQIYGINAYEPPPKTDKTMRLNSVTDLFENGFVHLPREAPWLADYVRELTSFPGAKYDDQVDSTTQALEYMRGPSAALEIWERLGKD